MDHINDVSLIGPGFIEQLAEKQLSSGLETDYAALSANARAWTEDRTRMDQLERENARLQDRIDRIGQAVQAH